MPPVPPAFFGRGRKARRGDVRAAILALLKEEPLNGYQVMQAIAERSHGAWRPSPGAVYPALSQLSDEGLVQPTGEGRRTLYELTETGTAYVAEHADETHAPWEAMTPHVDDAVWELMDLAQQSATALMQVTQSASPAQLAKAKKVLEDGRRQLYQILADGDDETAEDIQD
jgi:DNA-binding PadR family transcriptional regulator